MGWVKVPYYVTRRAWKNSRATWGYWSPTKKMKAMGFHLVCCGEHGPEAITIAQMWNARWKTAQEEAVKQSKTSVKTRNYPPGSLGEAFASFRGMAGWAEKKPRTQEEWWRAWKYIGEVFGDKAPAAISAQQFDRFRAVIERAHGPGERYRTVKIWRALWAKIARLKSPLGGHYCELEKDPSQLLQNTQPKPRSAVWTEGEAIRLAKQAWRDSNRGLAALLKVAWDTMLSPVDVRTLTLAQLRSDAQGAFFTLARAKTGKPAIATLSKAGKRALDAYIASLPFQLLPNVPIFHTRGGAPGPKGGRPRPPVPFTADTLGDDFRVVREKLFPGDTRTLMDFRRSGAVEAKAGGVDPLALADKMANTIDSNKALQSTYLPVSAEVVRLVDGSRVKGRQRLR